jgi:hypothetical protein
MQKSTLCGAWIRTTLYPVWDNQPCAKRVPNRIPSFRQGQKFPASLLLRFACFAGVTQTPQKPDYRRIIRTATPSKSPAIMPKSKRVKGAPSKKGAKGETNEAAHAAPGAAEDSSSAPIISPDSDNQWAEVARKLWLKPKRTRAKTKIDVVKKEIWDPLEGEGFRYPPLLALENVQALESYLWPGFDEDSSDYHVLLIALLANVKRREQLETWCWFSLANGQRRRVR